MHELINLKEVNLSNGRLVDINLSIFDNEVITIIGPNGGGKTSLLKLIANIEKPLSGNIVLRKECRISYMPQRIRFDSMLPMTVKNFLQINNYGICDKDIEYVIEKVDIKNVINTQVNIISSGQLQKVLFAKCILMKPDVMLLDEPVSNLDIKAQDNFYTILEDVRSEKKCTVIMASHDLHIVMNRTDKVICLNNRISCQGTIKDVEYHKEFIHLFGKNLVPYRHYHDR